MNAQMEWLRQRPRKTENELVGLFEFVYVKNYPNFFFGLRMRERFRMHANANSEQNDVRLK